MKSFTLLLVFPCGDKGATAFFNINILPLQHSMDKCHSVIKTPYSAEGGFIAVQTLIKHLNGTGLPGGSVK